MRTQREKMAHIRSLGMTVRKRDGEFRVNRVGGTEEGAYYATDIDDAVGTAEEMARWWFKKEEPMALLYRVDERLMMPELVSNNVTFH